MTLRLSDSAAAHQARQRAIRADRERRRAHTGSAGYPKQLVYYDGPTDDDRICGQGGGSAGRVGHRRGVPRDLHGRSDGGGRGTRAPPRLRRARLERAAERLPGHARPPLRQRHGHPVPVRRDVAAQLAPPRLRSERLLRHSGAWLDVQDSPWLRLVNRQVPSRSASPGGRRSRATSPGSTARRAAPPSGTRGRPSRSRRSPRRGSGSSAGRGPAAARSGVTWRSRRRPRSACCSRPSASGSRLRQREGRGHGRRGACRSALRASGDVVHCRCGSGDGGEGLAVRRLDRRLPRTHGRLHAADDEDDVVGGASSEA